MHSSTKEGFLFSNSIYGFAEAFRCVGPILLIIITKLQTAFGKGRMEGVAFWHANDEVTCGHSHFLHRRIQEFLILQGEPHPLGKELCS